MLASEEQIAGNDWRTVDADDLRPSVNPAKHN